MQTIDILFVKNSKITSSWPIRRVYASTMLSKNLPISKNVSPKIILFPIIFTTLFSSTRVQVDCLRMYSTVSKSNPLNCTTYVITILFPIYHERFKLKLLSELSWLLCLNFIIVISIFKRYATQIVSTIMYHLFVSL